MSEGIGSRQWLLLGAVILLALGLRLPALDAATVTHPEFYMPGIDVPEYVHHPVTRTTLPEVIRSVWSRSDIHPPGFYIGALGWTNVFGTSHWALRLPAALIGTATVVLLFLLGRRTDNALTGALAASMLALHGFHVSKSTMAELWIWPAFWAVLSVWLLRGLLVRTEPVRALLYVATLAVALWSEYSLWLFVATQIVYVALCGCRAPAAPTLLRLQAQAVVLGLPVLIHLRQDLGSGDTSYLSQSPVELLPIFLGFGSAAAIDTVPRWFGGSALEDAVRWLIAALGTALLVIGLRRHQAGLEAPPPSDDVGSRWWLPIAALNAAVLVAYPLVVPSGWKLSLLLGLAGFGAAVAWKPVVGAIWPTLSRALRPLAGAPGLAALLRDPIAWHALAFPFFAVVASLFTPMLAPRVLLSATPFLLLTMARGLRHLFAPGRFAIAWPVAALVLGILAFTAYDARTRPTSTREYRAVAAGLDARREPDDVIVTRYDWFSAPLHYYLTQDRYDFIRLGDLPGRDRAEIRRAWLIVYGDPEADRARAELARFEEALGSGFVQFDSFDALEVRVVGFRRETPPSEAGR
jgi:hypothetical protein